MWLEGRDSTNTFLSVLAEALRKTASRTIGIQYELGPVS